MVEELNEFFRPEVRSWMKQVFTEKTWRQKSFKTIIYCFMLFITLFYVVYVVILYSYLYCKQ